MPERPRPAAFTLGFHLCPQAERAAALAALAVAGVASAQSSVTLFGVVDASISGYSAKNAGGYKETQRGLSSSGYNSSRLGFRGTEDLGGGLAAGFWLEAGINNDTGTGSGKGGGLAFNRRSTVSLSGAFGEVRLGRDYTATFWNDTVFDPFGTNGVGTSLISNINVRLASTEGFGSAVSSSDNYIRTSNSIGYFLPANLGGFYGQVQYAFPENVKQTGAINSPSKKGQYVGGRFGYANGPLDVAVAYGQSTVVDSASLFARENRKLNTFNLGASYDFGPAKLFGEFAQTKDKDRNAQLAITSPASGVDKYNGYLFGVTVPVGAGLIRASYGGVKYKTNYFNEGTTKDSQVAVGYVHNLSKRTALYATLSHITIKNGMNNPEVMGAVTGGSPTYLSAPRSATGYDFGIRHAF